MGGRIVNQPSLMDILAIFNEKAPSIPVENIIRDKIYLSFLDNEPPGVVKKEVHTPVGRIDLLTEKFILEFKRIKKWKDAVGQILVYSCYYPEKTKVIYLIGSATEKYKKLIQHHCTALSIVSIFSEIDIEEIKIGGKNADFKKVLAEKTSQMELDLGGFND